jgi:hypothetical protein
MTITERMEQLLEHGATIQLVGRNLTLTLAGCHILTGPSRLRWCALFPEHQGHIHETPYTRITLVAGDRDIAFWQGKRMIAYIAPFEESGLSLDSVVAVLAKWRAYLNENDNAVQFENFFNQV